MTHIKDPEARLDYTWDWTDWLTDGDQIVSATIETVGVDTTSTDHTGTHVTAWLTGGTPGTTARATARITTVQGRTDDRTITLQIAHR